MATDPGDDVAAAAKRLCDVAMALQVELAQVKRRNAELRKELNAANIRIAELEVGGTQDEKK